MNEHLQEIMRDASRIAAACAPSIVCPTPKIRRQIQSLSFPSAPYDATLASAASSLAPRIQHSLSQLFSHYVSLSEKGVAAEWLATVQQLESMETIGGMSNAKTEQLVQAAYQRQHLRRIEMIKNTLLRLVESQGGGQQRDEYSGTFQPRVVAILESAFQRKSTLNNAETIAIAQMTKITPVQVRTWFQNRRNRQRKGHKPSSSLIDQNEPSTSDSTRTISALPRRRSGKPTLPSSVDAESDFNTTPNANGSGRRVKAMPKRAFPPIHQQQQHNPSSNSTHLSSSTPHASLALAEAHARGGPSPAPSMARSLSAHSSVSDVSSVDPTGGFNSLLINPNDTPPQITFPHIFTPGFSGDMSSLRLGSAEYHPEHTAAGYEGGGEGQGIQWDLNFALPQMAIFDPLQGLDFDFDMLGYDLSGLGGIEMDLLGGAAGGVDSVEGVPGLGGLTLAATPNFTESPSNDSPTRLTSSATQGQTQGQGQVEGEAVSSADWAWAGSIAEQMAALFAGEGKNWIAEMEAGVIGGNTEAEPGPVGEAAKVVQEKEAEQGHSGSPDGSRSTSRSESRSITPPPIVPQFHTTQPTPTRPHSASTHPIEQTSSMPSTPSAPDFGSLAIPIPYYPQQHPQHSRSYSHSYSAQYALGQHSTYPTHTAESYGSRHTSYGSSISSGSSMRIITPPSSEFSHGHPAYYQPEGPHYTGQGYETSEVRMQGQGRGRKEGKKVAGEMHSRRSSAGTDGSMAPPPPQQFGAAQPMGQFEHGHQYPAYDALPYYPFDPYSGQPYHLQPFQPSLHRSQSHPSAPPGSYAHQHQQYPHQNSDLFYPPHPIAQHYPRPQPAAQAPRSYPAAPEQAYDVAPAPSVKVAATQDVEVVCEEVAPVQENAAAVAVVAESATRAEEEQRWTPGILAFDSPCSVE